MNDSILQSELLIWAVGLMVGVPLVVLLFNELSFHFEKRSKHIRTPLRTVRNIILPLFAVSLLLTHVFSFSTQSYSIKILQTTVWILAINAALALINAYLFSGAKNPSGWRGKVPQLFLDLFRVAMVLVGAAIVLSSVWEMNLGNLVTALGLGSFVIGLALQDTLGNLFTGIALVYEKPFSEGDWIEIEGHSGRVIEMNWRAVRICTREGVLIAIPHLMIGQGLIVNWSKPKRIHVLKHEVDFALHIPPNRVKEALMETCLQTPGILHEPVPEVKVVKYNSSATTYEIEFGIADFPQHEEVSDELMTRLWYTAHRHDLQMPYQQITLHNAKEVVPPKQLREEALIRYLEQLPSLLPIEKSKADKLQNGSQMQHFGRGEIILKQGEPTGPLYVIAKGDAAIQVNIAGEAQTISEVHEGDFFGEVALFGSRTNTFAVKALTDLEVMRISPNEVLKMVEKNARLAHLLDEVMDARRKAAAEVKEG